ncbi:MAG: hypothetical protein ACFB9N_02420 [Geitlerinemataceae cyanobacterium]
MGGGQDKRESGDRTETEQQALDCQRLEADTLALRKAHTAALLRWRDRAVLLAA